MLPNSSSLKNLCSKLHLIKTRLVHIHSIHRKVSCIKEMHVCVHVCVWVSMCVCVYERSATTVLAYCVSLFYIAHYIQLLPPIAVLKKKIILRNFCNHFKWASVPKLWVIWAGSLPESITGKKKVERKERKKMKTVLWAAFLTLLEHIVLRFPMTEAAGTRAYHKGINDFHLKIPVYTLLHSRTGTPSRERRVLRNGYRYTL